MNFSLKTKKGKKLKDSSTLGFGLNNRKKKKPTSAFGGDSSSSEDEDKQNFQSTKDQVNRELASEQAALRRRAEKAMSNFSSEYDYDAEYESFSTNNQLKKKQMEKSKAVDDGPKESRYIGTLMEKAKERQQEREIIKERKIAREQEMEDLNQDYMGKDKFVTSAYKRKLEERKAWLEKDAKRSKLEEEEDVTKRKGGGIMGFYSNFTNNIAVGGAQQTDMENAEEAENKRKRSNQRENYVGESMQCEPSSTSRKDMQGVQQEAESEEELETTLAEQAMIVKRLQKIFDARERYLQRKASKD